MQLTKNQKIMKIAGLLYGITFIIAILVFIFLPDVLFKYINLISNTICSSLPDYPLGENKFWLSMTVSMMIGVTITSLLIYKNIKKYYTMALPLIAMKFTSATMGLGFFIVGFAANVSEWTALANAIIFVTDFPLGLFMVIMYKKVSKEIEG